MKKVKKIILYGLFIFSPGLMFAQTPPGSGVGNYDKNWYTSIPQFTYNFSSGNGTSFSSTWNKSSWASNSSAQYCSDNVGFTTVGGNTVLQLEALYSSPPSSCSKYNFTIGQIATNDNILYTYGYYEAKMELPSYGEDYNDAFFLHSCANNISHDLDCEILAPPINPTKTSALTNYSTNTWTGNCNPNGSIDNYQQYLPTSRLDNSFHIYSLEWFPDHIIWYFDGTPFRMIHLTSTIAIPPAPANIYLGIGFHDSINSIARDSFPGYMYVQYVNSYFVNEQCGTAGSGCSCNNNITFNTRSDITSFYPTASVQGSITFGSGTAISLQTTDIMYFRAQNGFTIKGPFTIPKGAVFGLLETQCY